MQMAKLLEAWDGFDSVQRFARKYGKLNTLRGYLADLDVYFRWLPSVGASLNPDELVRDDLKCVYESSATDVGFKRRHTDLLGLYVKVHLVEKGWMSLQGTGRSRSYDSCRPSNTSIRIMLDLLEILHYFPDLKCAIPFKRRGLGRGHRGEKGKELTPEQESFNKELSKARVVVEHTISTAKKFDVFGTEFLNRRRNYDTMTDIASGLVNLRIMRSKGLFLN